VSRVGNCKVLVKLCYLIYNVFYSLSDSRLKAKPAQIPVKSIIFKVNSHVEMEISNSILVFTKKIFVLFLSKTFSSSCR